MRPPPKDTTADGEPDERLEQDTTITTVLRDWREGKPGAFERLFLLVIRDLRRLAHRYLRSKPTDPQLQTTLLLDDLYFALRKTRPRCTNRTEFFGLARTIIHDLLTDYGRRRSALKRGGKIERVVLDEQLGLTHEQQHLDADTLVAVNTALGRLAKADPRARNLVHLKFFLGLTISELAEELGSSQAQVKRQWLAVRQWLAREMSARSPEAGDLHDEPSGVGEDPGAPTGGSRTPSR